MCIKVVLSFLLVALTAQATTPEVGKDKLRRLVKLPVVTFQSDWTFDPERGFTIGSESQDIASQITDLKKELTKDTRDAARYYQLGQLYTKINETGAARNTWNKSVELYRKRVELQPENGTLLTEFGRALQDAGKRTEAESILRQAVRVAPKDWKCWAALGSFLDGESRRNLGENPKAFSVANKKKNTSEPFRPAFAEVSQAEKWLEEAGSCFDKAVAAAPEESEVYYHRAMHLSLRNFLLKEIQRASGLQEDGEPITKCFSQESLSDLKRASELCPTDYQRIASLALFEIYTANNGRVNWHEGLSWNSLPDRSQRLIREAMTRLQDLAQNSDPRLAAGALEALGILQGPVLQENRICLETLRRAITLDPSREQAWEALSATLAKAHNYSELFSVCEERLKQKDAPHNRVLFAKACEKMKLWDTAEEQILAALKQAPLDFSANLSLAALLLRRSQDSSLMLEANGWLGRSESLLSSLSDQYKTKEQVIDLALTRSIYFALNDDVDSARQWVKVAMEKDKDNDLAREILSAMTF
ncbi:MAG: Tetratricopeptide 2 repeat protein [Pedosphaera sp.]|nr:Tetratricopeptide 2 repeat protein [Pedosphaera sp.]